MTSLLIFAVSFAAGVLCFVLGYLVCMHHNRTDMRDAFRTGWEIRQRSIPGPDRRGPPADIDQLLREGSETRRGA